MQSIRCSRRMAASSMKKNRVNPAGSDRLGPPFAHPGLPVRRAKDYIYLYLAASMDLSSATYILLQPQSSMSSPGHPVELEYSGDYLSVASPGKTFKYNSMSDRPDARGDIFVRCG